MKTELETVLLASLLASGILGGSVGWASNVAPSFTKGADVTAYEGSGANTIAKWAKSISAGSADEKSQALTFELSNDNTALFAVQPALNASGTLTFTVAGTDLNGVANVTVILKDNGGTADGGSDTSATQTFKITIKPVNDPPSFTKGANQTVLEDSGKATVANWATAIDAGPDDEDSQQLTFVVTSNNKALFAEAPAISAGGALTFTPAPNANGTATITVVVKDDGGAFKSGSIVSQNSSAPQTFTITMTAVNDPPSFTKGKDVEALEDAGAVAVTKWASAISAGPTDEKSQALSFELTNDNNALFSVQPAIDSAGTLKFTVAGPNLSGTANVSATLKDNGGTANGGNDTSATQTFKITVKAVNDFPSFTKGANQTVLEDSGSQTVAGWATNISAGPADESSQTLIFLVSNNNKALFSSQPAVAADGTLTYTPAANMSGTATVTVQLKDSGGTFKSGKTVVGKDTSDPQTFAITVTGINDVPIFTKGPNVTVSEDAGSVKVPKWAKGISAGLGNESTQSLAFELSNDNPSLFSVQPEISAAGLLTFTPAANKSGAATVSAVLKDDGGTANGGVDTSAAQTFTITVNAVNDRPEFTLDHSSISVLKNGGAQSIAMASSITRGPSDEAGQTLSFTLKPSKPALFSVKPAIDADTGVLTFTPGGTTGSTTVSVVLTDSGGTANGGKNTSLTKAFTVTVSDSVSGPDIRISPTALTFEQSGALIAVTDSGALTSPENPNEIRLKTSVFVPPVGIQAPSQSISITRQIIQFDGAVQASVLQNLASKGVQIVEWIPRNAVLALVPANADLKSVAGLRWVGQMNPQDKISPKIEVSLTKGFVLVDFYSDVTSARARSVLAGAGAFIQENPYVGKHTFLVHADAPMVDTLSRLSDVSWIWPASQPVINGEAVYRCPGPETILGPVGNYVTRGSGWDGDGQGAVALTFHFENGTPDIAGTAEEDEVLRALQEWSKYAKITWTETASVGLSKSFDIKWASGNHGDGSPFDGPFGVLAHGFYPAPPNPETIAGDIHFDEAETWKIGSDIDLFSVALHEGGHALGMDHSSDPTAVMYPIYQLVTGLRPDDIAGIQSIYAAETGDTFTIYNDGSGTLSVTSITAQYNGSTANWISWSPQGPFTIAAGASQAVQVTINYSLAPSGTTTSRLLIVSDDPDESPYPNGVNVTVTRTSGALRVSPAN